MPIIYVCDYEHLPDWVDADDLPNNGSGKEYATYLVIEDGANNRVYSDAMELEDCCFYRDLKWIEAELKKAYGIVESRKLDGR